MIRLAHLGRSAVAGLLLAIPAVLIAQDAPQENKNPAPCSVTPQPQPCGAAPAGTKPSTADRFPFPGESSGKDSSGTPSINGVPESPSTSSSTPQSTAKPDAAKQFPFPGENGRANAPDASSNSSSSSSSSDNDLPVDPGATPDSTPGAPGLKDKGSEGTTSATPGRHILHRVNPIGTKLQTPDEREAEDLDVAHFYLDSGDIQGAYLRSQDAVKTMPDDPDAHFALAEIAAKLNKRDEAIAEYNACLKLDPTNKQAKASRKALARLKP